MRTLYCDASFDWTQTAKNGENIVRGKIAVVGEGISRIDKVAIGKVDGLQQYINILELTAIARAVELASELPGDDKSLAIYSDSRIAVGWASQGKVKDNKVMTLAHASAFDYLKKVRMDFGGIITFNFTNREYNPAGHLLERIPIPRRRKVRTVEENLEALNNDGRKEVAEDFSDSPHADREPIQEDGE